MLEMRLYFDQTRGDCGKTNPDGFGKVYAINVLVLKEKLEGVWLYFST